MGALDLLLALLVDSVALCAKPVVGFRGRPLGLGWRFSSSSSSPRPEVSISASLLSGMSKALAFLGMGRARRRRGRRFWSVAVESGMRGRETGFGGVRAGVGELGVGPAEGFLRT